MSHSDLREDPARRCLARGISTLLGILSIFVLPIHAQVYSGSITGAVTDPSGAVIPGVKVVATDVDKGFTYPTATNSAGWYTIENLPPSTYTLSLTASGFRTATRPGITLAVGQNATVNVELSLGSTTESVTVTGAPPLLEAQDATTGQTVERGLINNLPLVGRSFLDLAYLSPGVNPLAGSALGSGGSNKFTSNGGRGSTASILLDGVPVTAPNQNTQVQQALYSPSVEAVQEFKIEQNSSSADKGFSGNTVVNVVIRSGTNKFHGSAYDFLRNRTLNANDWFSNRAGVPLPAMRVNDFGFTLGGPIQKNRTFFFGDYEGKRTANAAKYAGGVPSAAERQGDFAEICRYNNGTFNAQGQCSSSRGQLWDPYSAVYNPATGVRNMTAFIPFNNLATYMSPGSALLAGTKHQLPARPGNLIDPVAAKMIQYFPLPNVNVGAPSYNRFNNWASAGSNSSHTNQFDTKLDRQISDLTHFDVRFSMSKSGSVPSNPWQNPLFGGGGLTDTRIVSTTMHATHSFSPTFLLAASYGFTRYATDTDPLLTQFPDFNALSNLGLPSYLATGGFNMPPSIVIGSGYTSSANRAIGPTNTPVLRSRLEVHNPQVSLARFRGSHQFQFGGEVRMMRDNFYQPLHPGGQLSYDFTSTSRTPAAADGGDAMASFLTGVPANGDYSIRPAVATQSFDYAGWFQDNWRATSKLTLNLGLRYELSLPRTERFNRQSWLDLSVTSPLSGLALSPQATRTFSQAGLPVPNLSTLRGGLRFAGGSQRYPVDVNYKGFAPRFGFAYRLDQNTVLRGGYGIFYVVTDYTVAGTGAAGFDGFSQNTALLTTYQGNGFTPWGRLNDPFPNGLNLPPGSSLGLATELGVSASGLIRDRNQLPYMQAWNFGVQRQIGSVLADVEYVGTKGTHLYSGGAGGLNHLGNWIESATPAQIQALNTFVPNPFNGVISTTGCTICGPTVKAVQLALPFPQFAGFSAASPPWANSNYHALQLKVEKRLSRGLGVFANYTWSKSIDNASVPGANVTSQGGGTAPTAQNPNNLALERSLSEFDIPHVFSFSYVYRLPFGRGQRWGSQWGRLAGALLGGWQTQGFWRFDSGQPLDFTLSGGLSNPFPTYGPQHPNLTGTLTRNNCDKTCLAKQYFANPSAAVAPARFTLGNAPRTLGSVRAQGTNNANLSLSKSFPIRKLGESGEFQFRIETFNALNRVQFDAPNTAVGNAAFGLVTSQANSPRQVQLAAKLSW